MKKYYIVFLLIAVSLVSCDDFLDTKDYTNKNDQTRLVKAAPNIRTD